MSVTGGEAAEVQFVVQCEDALIGQIAFFSNRDGNNEIFVMDADESDPVNLSNDPGLDVPGQQAWGP